MNKDYYVDDVTLLKVSEELDYIITLGGYIELLENELLENTDRDKIEVLASEYASLLSLRDELEVDEFDVLGDISNGEFELLTADEVDDLIEE